MKAGNRGFTLFEMMITIAIIGMLAAIAIPAYQDYVGRTQASEAIELLGGGKAPLAEFYSDKMTWPAAAASAIGTLSGKYTATVAIISGMSRSSLSMQLQATMKSVGVNRQIAGKTLILSTADGGRHWACSTGVSNGIGAKFLPGSCK